MARPVIVDDGGSIRIKRIEGDGKMDGLLTAKEHTLQNDPTYTNAFIGWILEAGGAGTQPIGQFKKIKVSTDSGQKVEVSFNNQDKLKIKVSGSPGPVINPQFGNGKFSYTVVNAGNINRIEYKDQTGADQDFIFPGPTVYMGVFIT